MMMPEYKTVVVLGAGPAGLAIGHELTRRGIDFIIVEKGNQAGESFSHYPKHIFFGPWMNNLMPGSRIPWYWRLKRATQPDYTYYLGEYARHHRLPICFSAEVTRVSQDHSSGMFLVETSRGPIHSRLVINCTGYFSTANVPNVPGLLAQGSGGLVWMHSQQYREASDLSQRLGRGYGRVLIVGAGLTAGETLVELNRKGFECFLSHRGPLKIGPSPMMEALLSPIMALVEKVALTMRWPLNSNPPMAGGETTKLLRSGRVPTYPPLSYIDSARKMVEFEDGRTLELDAIVFCTGYRYTTAHLESLLGSGPLQVRNMESSVARGLFFLGLDHQRTYRSRFLRGIRADARILGEVIAQRLELPTHREEGPGYQVLEMEQLPSVPSGPLG